MLPAHVCAVCLLIFFYQSAVDLPAFGACPSRHLALPATNFMNTVGFFTHVTEEAVHIRMENGHLCNSLSIPNLPDHRSVITHRGHSYDVSIMCVLLRVVKYNILLYLSPCHLSIIYLSSICPPTHPSMFPSISVSHYSSNQKIIVFEERQVIESFIKRITKITHFSVYISRFWTVFFPLRKIVVTSV